MNRPKWFVNKKRLSEYTQSAAERKIEDILISIPIDYKMEISFNACISDKGNLLVFDFVIPSLFSFIEYDGKQHEEVELIKYHDNIKTEFLLNNNYRLLRLNSKNWRTLKEDILSFISGEITKPKERNKNQKKENNKKNKRWSRDIGPCKPHKKRKSKKEREKIRLRGIPVTIEDYNHFVNKNKIT